MNINLIENRQEFLNKARQSVYLRKKIVLGITDLSFHRVTGSLVAYILENMGFEVICKYSQHEENFRRLKSEEIDMIASAWIPSSHGIYKHDVEKEIPLIELGLHYNPYALWGVPDYISKNDIDEITDLLKLDVLGKIRKDIQGIGLGAGITRFSIKMMEEYSLNDVGYKFKTGTQEQCIRAFEDAYSKKEWLIVPLWQPQFLHHTYKIRELKDPLGLLGIIDKAVLLCSKNKIESNLTIEQIEILDNLILSNEIVSYLDYLVERKGLTEREAIEKWFNE
jgi:glycine betaine/proline transport system substrate-binding protein